MVSHYLRTELRSEIEPVELAWDTLWRFDGGAEDRSLAEPLVAFMRRQAGPWILLGQEDLAQYISEFDTGSVEFERITIAGQGPLSDADVLDLATRALPRLGEDRVNALLCLVDRYDAHRVMLNLPSAARVHTLDVLKDTVSQDIPVSAWRKKFDHIYPTDIPELSIRKHLDVLLLDLPARSLAQLPIGFAYVYKAVRQAGVNVQAIDVDLVAYHRYHARRCLNYIHQVHCQDLVHPQDPWQAENYIVWTDKRFVEYFADILDEVARKVIEAKPKVLGLSLHQTSHVSVKRVVERVRQALPDVVIIVGGMSCYQHFVARQIFPEADYVVVGEADTMVGPLTAALARGERPSDLPGVVSRYDTESRAFVGAPLPHNLDIVGAPDYGFANLDHYVNWNGYRLMPLVGSRGCGWSRCTFCAERFNWRARTPELVAEEIEHYTTRGFRDFVFNESDFNSNLSFVTRLCYDIIRRGIKANFTAQLRIGKDCDFEYYKTMKQAGFSCLRFGVDGLSENTLRLQRKGYTKEMVMSNLKHCHDLGIYTEINVVIGVPGETDEDVDESADFIIQMKPYIGRVAFINPLMMFVGSVYYFEPERHHIKFVGDRDELYRQYFVSLPDSCWYSENPYIDHKIRRKRFFRIVEELHNEGVPLGAFANFTAEFRKEFDEDSHTSTQQSAVSTVPNVASNTRCESMAPDVADVAAWAGESLSPTPRVVDLQADAGKPETHEFQKTFYGSWSAAFLNKGSWAGHEVGLDPGTRILKLEGEFYLPQGTSVQHTQLVRIYPSPVLLKSHSGYNLVGYQDQVLGAPIVLGPLDLTQEQVRNDPSILKGHAEDEIIRMIDLIEAAKKLQTRLVQQAEATDLLGDAARFFPVPTLLCAYRLYNLVGFRDQTLGAPLSLGHLDLTQDAVRADRRIVKGRTKKDVMDRINALESADAKATADESLPVSPVQGSVGRRAGVLLRAGK